MADRIRLKVPFSLVPEWIIYHPEASDRAVRLYCVLARYADHKDGGGAFPSRKTLANHLRCSRDSVDRALRELVAIEAISVERRLSDVGDPTSNLYTVHISPTEGVAAQVRPPLRTHAATGSRTHAEGGSRTGAALTRANLNENQMDAEAAEMEQIIRPGEKPSQTLKRLLQEAS